MQGPSFTLKVTPHWPQLRVHSQDDVGVAKFNFVLIKLTRVLAMSLLIATIPDFINRITNLL